MNDISLCYKPISNYQCKDCLRSPVNTNPNELWQSYIMPQIENEICDSQLTRKDRL